MCSLWIHSGILHKPLMDFITSLFPVVLWSCKTKRQCFTILGNWHACLTSTITCSKSAQLTRSGHFLMWRKSLFLSPKEHFRLQILAYIKPSNPIGVLCFSLTVLWILFSCVLYFWAETNVEDDSVMDKLEPYRDQTHELGLLENVCVEVITTQESSENWNDHISHW